jgi:tetratricopeptide (TPR) repeat protein
MLALRPSQKTLEDLPAARPMPLHRGLAVGEAARYAIFLARQRQIPLTQEQARLIARAVDGHPLLVEQLVAQARRRDLDDLLLEISERQGDFASLVETVYAWSASRLDEAGLAAWAALTLFPVGSAPEGLLRAAVGQTGLQNLRECALADFDAAGQVWRWHATVAEYALGHWPLSEEERRTRLVALLPAWTRWLERQQARERWTLNRLEESRPNLEAVLDACTGASYEEVWVFLDGLDACLPEPERTLTLRELVARVRKAKLIVLPAGEEARRAGLLNNLSIALSALGRREDALKPSEEAVDIRRKLAASNPQAFLPNLATSLGSYGSILQDLERDAQAAQAFAEGLQHLAPFYRDLPTSLHRPGE